MTTKMRMKVFLMTMTATMMTISLMSLTPLFTKNNLLLYLTKNTFIPSSLFIFLIWTKDMGSHTQEYETWFRVLTHSTLNNSSLIFHHVLGIQPHDVCAWTLKLSSILWPVTTLTILNISQTIHHISLIHIFHMWLSVQIRQALWSLNACYLNFKFWRSS